MLKALYGSEVAGRTSEDGHEQSMSMITRQTASGWDRGSQGLPPNDRQCLNLPFTIL